MRGLEDADPIPIIIVEFIEQSRLLVASNLCSAEPHAAVVGLPVEVMFEEIDDGVVLPQFRPRRGPDGSSR